MKQIWNAVVIAMMVAAPASAQRGLKQQQQAPLGAANRPLLLQEIQRRFMNQARTQMGLTAEQLPRFQKVVSSWAQKRVALEADERRLRQALNEQYRLGVAANPDSAAKFVDAINDNRVDYATTFRDEMRELTPILSPVQRGQFQLIRDRLLTQIRDLQQKRPDGGPDQ